MTVVITGMSGVGTSTVLAELSRRGHRAVDTGYDGYAVETHDGQVWDEARTTNPIGKTPEQRARVAADHAAIEPLLRAGATAEQDARRPAADPAGEIEAISASYRARSPR